jgi:hypothetical protein
VSHKEGQKHLSIADSLWNALERAIHHYLDNKCPAGALKASEAHDAAPLNTSFAKQPLRHANSLMELHRAHSFSCYQNEPRNSNVSMQNTWKPDPPNCHMQTIKMKDIQKQDGKETESYEADVKVYWNKISPPGAFHSPQSCFLTSLSLDQDLSFWTTS